MNKKAKNTNSKNSKLSLQLDERTIQGDVLRDYPKAVVHLRRQYYMDGRKRLGLIFGSGASKSLKIPNWNELITKISKDPRVLGEEILNKTEVSQGSRSQMLFHHFVSKQIKLLPQFDQKSVEFDRIVSGRWKEIIRENLYSEIEVPPENLIVVHPWMVNFLKIVRNTPLTVNYNFDDCIQEMIFNSLSPDERKKSKGYETVWDARQQFRKPSSVIYHPNGFLPRNSVESSSEKVIFLEDSFADQLIDMFAGHYATLLNHISTNTCLFLGLSLQDSSIKNLLRQNARLNPGHFHYYVEHMGEHKVLTDEQRYAIRLSNFEVFNLITLFLDDNQIRALGSLILMDDQPFEQLAKEVGVNTKYTYYITGAIASGKSTIVSYLRDLMPFDEWIEPKIPELAKDFNQLTQEEQEKVDDWIARQFGIKNQLLSDYKVGIFIVDRSPLDPVSFTLGSEWKNKASRLLKAIRPGESEEKAENGHVLLLQDDPQTLDIRVKGRRGEEKSSGEKYLSDMQKALLKIYEAPGVTVINEKNMPIGELVKKVAKTIHLDEYQPLDLDRRLTEVESGRVKSPQGIYSANGKTSTSAPVKTFIARKKRVRSKR